MKSPVKSSSIRNSLVIIAAIALASCVTVNKGGSDEKLESLRKFELGFVDQFAVPKKRFDAASFDAEVQRGNAKFEDTIKAEKLGARRPVLQKLQEQFQDEAAHLRKKASAHKITPALGEQMKRVINKNYDNALSKKEE